MVLDDEFLKQILETFRSELEEQSQTITDGLLELEKLHAQGKEAAEPITKIFRAAHNIKGSSRGIGVKDVGEISHHVETLFLAIQKKTVAISPEVISLCLSAVDKMKEALAAYIEKTALDFDLPAFLSQLGKFAGSAPHATETPPPAPVARQETKPSKAVERAPPPAPEPENTVELKSPPAASKTEAPKPSEYETMRVSLYNLNRVSAYLEEMQISKIAIDHHYDELAKLNIKTKQFQQVWKRSLLELRESYRNDASEPLQKLYDSTMGKLSDIALTVNRMHKVMTVRINEFTVVSNSLQDEVRVLRLIPVNTFLRNLPRTVRDLATNLKKQVELEIKDNDAKIDKIVLEDIKDPINHILRNAIDHAIESPEVRKSKNKPPMGHIKIQVKEENNQVIFMITDDGAGIDPKKISDIAIKKGLVTRSEVDLMSKDEALDLIFRPGFSTKDVVTDISGRGVGLDVVKSNLTNLRGSVNIETEVGKGTTFYLRAPLSIATERGLIIKCSSQSFVITTSSVERVLLLSQKDIIEVEGSQAILLDKHPVVLCGLSDILKLGTKQTIHNEQLPIVVIRKSDGIAAFLVDQIIGEREIVIKRLQAPLVTVPCVAGATLSGSGDVIIVLNLSDVLERALKNRNNLTVGSVVQDVQPPAKNSILVVDDSLTTRTLLKNILTAKGYKVSLASDGLEACGILEKNKFCLLITDIEMPKMDGIELTRQVKKNESLQDLPVIIITSREDEEMKTKGLEAGADAFFIKREFESSELIRIVEQMVEKI